MSTLDLQQYMDNLLDDGEAPQADNNLAGAVGGAVGHNLSKSVSVSGTPTSMTQSPQSSIELTLKQKPSPEASAELSPELTIQRDMLKQLFVQSKNTPVSQPEPEVETNAEVILDAVKVDTVNVDHVEDEINVNEANVDAEQDGNCATQTATPLPDKTPSLTALSERLDEQFQTLIFTIANVDIAIPLIDLGGIHRLKKIEHLIGKPHWFGGMTEIQGQHVNVVDGAKWILADRYSDALAAEIEAAGGYQYLVTLADSKWGIACSAVQDSKSVKHNAVKWRNPSAKRPWLAGLLKESMCAMLDSQQLIAMLDAGLHSNQR